jgi:hypothetical protein
VPRDGNLCISGCREKLYKNTKAQKNKGFKSPKSGAYMIRRRGRSMHLKGNRCGMRHPLSMFRLHTNNLLWEVL